MVPETMAAGGSTGRARRLRKRRCPICGRPTEPPYAPFCSLRCADVDLARWFSGAYRVPTEETVKPGEAGEASREDAEDG